MNDSSTPCEQHAAPKNSRRAFLTRAAAIAVVPAAAGIFASRHWLSAPPLAAGMSLATVHGLTDYVLLIGTDFQVIASDGKPAYVLTLAKAEPLKRHQPDVAEQFSLLFTPPDGHPLESRIYQLQHPVLGSVELFISPVGSAGRFGALQKGEAIINFERRAA